MNEQANQSNSDSLDQSTRKGIDLADILRYKLRGYTQTDIAAKLGVTQTTISQRLSGLSMLFDVDAITAYKTSRVQMLTATEAMLLSELWDPVRRAKASLNNVAYAYAQIHNSRRLEEGIATSIVDTSVNNMTLLEIINRRDILMAQLKSITTPSSPDTEQPRRTIDVTPDTPELT